MPAAGLQTRGVRGRRFVTDDSARHREASAVPGAAAPFHRPRLVARLTGAGPAPGVVVLVAPAGYGKTSLLRDWERHDSRPFAWLPGPDGTSGRVPHRLVPELERLCPPDHRLRALVDAAASAPTVLTALLQWLGSSYGPVVLVVDDLDRLPEEDVAAVAALAGRLPPGWTLAAAARRPAAAGRLTGGGAVELGAPDLAFTDAEARDLHRAAGTGPRAIAVRALVERTAGWPVAVALAARAAGGAVASGPELVRYVGDDVLAAEPGPVVEFLLRTSVLRYLSGPLCDAVLDTSGSAAMLAELRARNLFVEPLDGRGERLAYQPAFGEALLETLRRRDPSLEPLLHRRAARWSAEQGRFGDAVEHALAGGDVAAAARLVCRCAPPLLACGRRPQVLRWLAALGDEGSAAYPPLAVTAAWTWALEGDAGRALHQAEIAARARAADPPADRSASVESAAALVRAALAPGGVGQMVRDARWAVAAEPPGSPWHLIASLALGVAHGLAGEPDAAARDLERARLLGRAAVPAVALAAASELAAIAVDQDDWAAAGRHTAEVAELLATGNHEHLPHAALGYAVTARVSARDGDRDTATAAVRRSLRLHPPAGGGALPWLWCRTALLLGHASLSLDDPHAARSRLTDARRQVARLPDPGVLGPGVDGLAAAVERHVQPDPLPAAASLTDAELRVLRLLPTHLTTAEIAGRMGLSRNTVKTHVSALYRKLQISSRDGAVRRGQELGVLPPVPQGRGS
jgi:LuxR family maltose regulon positive regulatory protein